MFFLHSASITNPVTWKVFDFTYYTLSQFYYWFFFFLFNPSFFCFRLKSKWLKTSGEWCQTKWLTLPTGGAALCSPRQPPAVVSAASGRLTDGNLVVGQRARGRSLVTCCTVCLFSVALVLRSARSIQVVSWKRDEKYDAQWLTCVFACLVYSDLHCCSPCCWVLTGSSDGRRYW